MAVRDIGSFCAILAILASTGCGGGGSDQQVDNHAMLSLSPTNLTVSASIIDTAPTATFRANVQGQNGDQLVYITATSTNNGIQEVSVPYTKDSSPLPLPAVITVQFDSPATLGVGTYDDTIRVTACLDSACTQPVSGSPQTLDVHLTVTQAPSLSLKSVFPSSVTLGGPAFTLTVLGTGFSPLATVQWNDAALNTTYVSADELLAQVPASDIATTGTASVEVNDPVNSAGKFPAQTVDIVPVSIDAVGFQMNAAHTGAVSFKSVSFPSSPKWSTDVGFKPSYALIADGLVIVTSGSGLTALNQANGSIVWGPISIEGLSNAVYDNGQVFVLSAPNAVAAKLEAFDAKTGALSWKTTLTGQYSFTTPPTAADGTVYVTGEGLSATLYAVDETKGALRWTQTVEGNSAPAITADGVYVSYACAIYDFRPANGELVWSDSNQCISDAGSTPAVANQLLYSAGDSCAVYEAETGASVDTCNSYAPPALTASMGFYLLVQNEKGKLVGVQLSNNNVKWSFTGGGSVDGVPIVVNQYVFIGSGSTIFALDGNTGTQVWHATLPGGINTGDYQLPFTGLAAGDGLLVVPSGSMVVAYTLSAHP